MFDTFKGAGGKRAEVSSEPSLGRHCPFFVGCLALRIPNSIYLCQCQSTNPNCDNPVATSWKCAHSVSVVKDTVYSFTVVWTHLINVKCTYPNYDNPVATLRMCGQCAMLVNVCYGTLRVLNPTTITRALFWMDVCTLYVNDTIPCGLHTQ